MMKGLEVNTKYALCSSYPMFTFPCFSPLRKVQSLMSNAVCGLVRPGYEDALTLYYKIIYS